MVTNPPFQNGGRIGGFFLVSCVVMAADDEAPRLYPARYWGLDPIFSTHIKLFVRDLLVLPQFEDYKGKVFSNRYLRSAVHDCGKSARPLFPP